MGMWELGASDIPPKNIEVFPHRSIQRILGISMTEVKDQHIINETVRRKLFDIPNIKKDCNMTANLHWKSGTQLWQPSSIQNSHYMVQPQEKTWKCTAHKEKSIVRSLRLIILRVEKTRALKIWAHFAVDDRYWGHLISGLGTSSASTPPAPAPSIYRAHSPTTPPTLIP